jgi:D-alanyl-D-alanine dipeptidase
VVLAIVLASCKHKPTKPNPFIIPAASMQMVTAIVDDWSSTHATLRMWQRDGASWKPIGEAWPGVIGKTGAAWGDGLHGAFVQGRDGPFKHEGDGKSPAGVFDFRAVYGYAATPPPGAHYPYVALDDRFECVDDADSVQYTHIVDHDHVQKDWKSSEKMRRSDDLYTWVFDIAHNPRAHAGAGSCIFLHVWAGPDAPTVGCTAMAEPQLAHLIATLDPVARPVFVLLPRAEYTALAAQWGLPAQ